MIKKYKQFNEANEEDASHITCPICDKQLTTFDDSVYSDDVEELCTH